MANLLTFEVTGIQALLRTAEALAANVNSEIDDELNATALEIETKAKQYAPVYDGQIRNSIDVDKKHLDKTVNVLARHAAYIEFGTGSKVNIPAEWSQYAAQFKGKADGGGTWRDMLKSLTKWVHKKGLTGTYSVRTGKRTGKKADIQAQDEQVAYAIMRSILVKGLKPHPYLYPAFKEATNGLEQRILTIIQDAANSV